MVGTGVKRILQLVWLLAVLALGARAEERVERMLPGEKWWGMATAFGGQMPFDAASDVTIDITQSGYADQYHATLISDRGRVLHCEAQTRCRVEGGVITLVSSAEPISLETAEEGTLRAAFRLMSSRWFPPSGKTPDLTFFKAPQYNTWIELTYHQNERDILAYARSMLDHGFPPGVFMIDDTWQTAYGDWRFDGNRFRDPKGMCAKLRQMGFAVVLWICPFVGMDTPAYRLLANGVSPDLPHLRKERGGFLTAPDGEPAVVKWWNGRSALLDFTDPLATTWFKGVLDGLVNDYGVSGFKFDGGHLRFYTGNVRARDPKVSTGQQTQAYGRFCLDYPICEYRNAYGLAGQPIVERLHDKEHSWKDLESCVADMIAAGLLGHSFVCPDMIGGGSWTMALPGAAFDAELFVRSCQMQALCGMMQFSASPWRLLGAEGQRIVCESVRLRQRFVPYIVKTAENSARTGEPMLRNLEYAFPHQGFASVRDEFLLGEDLLVAPQLKKGAVSRQVILPPGEWVADDGQRLTGPRTVTVATPLARLPHFVRAEAADVLPGRP